MSHVSSAGDDSGNAAVEVLAIALIGGSLVCGLSFGLFTAQRDAFAAHQLARQAVRLFVLSGGDEVRAQLLPGLTARDLRLSESQVSLDISSQGGLARATAQVAGAKSWAVMGIQR